MKASIVGVTGYGGLELIKLLHGHRHMSLASVHARQEIGRPLLDLYPHLRGICDLKIEAFDAEAIMSLSDLVFFATPSGVSKELAIPFVEAGFPVIDLSGDFRLPSDQYQEWYQKEPAPQGIIDQFTYGLADHHDTSQSKFIANPGCYATATELALLPLIKHHLINTDKIIVDAKSGLSGAGKKLTDSSHFVNVHDNYITYKLNHHQHIPEIIQELKRFDKTVNHIQFSTSLIPVNRGIVASSYLELKDNISMEMVEAAFRSEYEDNSFIRVGTSLPTLHQVIGTNYTDIGYQYNQETGILTVVSVIDNLQKGAAGQAVQNMNQLFGFDKKEGLKIAPNYL